MESTQTNSGPTPCPGPQATPCDPVDISFDAIARFCAHQHYGFDADAWLSLATHCNGALQVLARYLAGTSWYGHSDELESIATRADELAETTSRPEDIDIARYSGAIRMHIMRSRPRGRQFSESEET